MRTITSCGLLIIGATVFAAAQNIPNSAAIDAEVHKAMSETHAKGTGLIYPMKSSVVRSMVADANAAAASGGWMTLDLALAQGFGNEMYGMVTGGCH